MLSFCRVRSSTSRCAAARRRSASALVSASKPSAWALAWLTILLGFFLGVAARLPGVLVGVPRGLVGLGAGLGRPLLGGGCPLLGLGHQRLGRGLGGGEPFGLLALGLFPPGRAPGL